MYTFHGYFKINIEVRNPQKPSWEQHSQKDFFGDKTQQLECSLSYETDNLIAFSRNMY